jgi:hypothetical protein
MFYSCCVVLFCALSIRVEFAYITFKSVSHCARLNFERPYLTHAPCLMYSNPRPDSMRGESKQSTNHPIHTFFDPNLQF